MAVYSTDPPLASNPGSGKGKTDARAHKSRTKAAAFLMLALVFGLGAAWLVARAIEKRSRPGEIAMTKVAVAALDLPLATTLAESHLAFVDWPTAVLPPGHCSEPRQLVGRVTARDIAKGEPLVETRLAKD